MTNNDEKTAKQQWFRDLPIGRKLRLAIFVTTATAMLVAAGVFMSAEWFNERRTMALELATLGEVIASNTTAAINFDDEQAATETLAALSARPEIQRACLYQATRGTATIKVFAAFGASKDCPTYIPDSKNFFHGQALHQFTTVRLSGEPIGTLYLQQNLKQLWTGLRRSAATMAIGLGVGLLLAFLLARLMRGPILRQVIELGESMDRVSNNGDYSVRARKSADDEVGRLVQGFNDMLVAVEERDDKLLHSQEALEQRVLERTHELSDAADKLEKSYRSLQSFAYVSSHHLQEPLRKIQAFGDVLKTRYASQMGEQADLYLSRMRAAAARMRKQLDDIRIYAELEVDDKPKVPVDLNKLLDNLIRSLAEPVKAKNGYVRKGRMPVINGHSTQLWLLFEHLLANSINFAANDRMLQIEITAEQDEEGWHRISIKDNGIGFDPTYTARIFQMFQRLDSQTTLPDGSTTDGTGVGLAICERIASLHGGLIEGVGIPDEGAIFTVVLPSSKP